MNLEDAVAAQVGTTPPETIQELILDACKATKVTGLDKFVNLRVLTLNGCGLKSLDDFPTLPELRTLELSDNQLVDGCLEVLQDAALLNLSCLRLAGNRFSSLDSLEPLSSCVNLKELDLFNCAVTETDNYRDGVFEMLPSLKYLDGFDADDNEKPDDDEEDDEEDGDEDLLSSEVGEDEDDLGEDDDEDDGLGDLGDLGESGDDGEDGESDLGGEEGEEGDEEDEEEEDDEDDGGDEEEGDAPGAKRQRR